MKGLTADKARVLMLPFDTDLTEHDVEVCEEMVAEGRMQRLHDRPGIIDYTLTPAGLEALRIYFAVSASS